MVVDSPRFKALTPPDLYSYVRDSVMHPDKLPYFRQGTDPARMTPQLANIKRMHDAGVRLLIGTDSGTPINYHTDSTRQQMELMVRAGIEPMKVLKMATTDAADYLNMSDSLGTIEAGKFADLIVVDGNPLVDMQALQYVTAVVKEGVQYKGPGTDVSVTRLMNTAK
jgi:imidazolonepropionase-like amidohydrolase